MKIQGQSVISTKTHLIVELREPFWSAYLKYGWEDKVEGFGISQDLVNRAITENKKIIVRYKGDYEITPKRARDKINFYHSVFVARNGAILGIVPRSAFKKLPEEEKAEVNMDVRMRLKEVFDSKYR